jgi:hypothetical protein
MDKTKKFSFVLCQQVQNKLLDVLRKVKKMISNNNQLEIIALNI